MTPAEVLNEISKLPLVEKRKLLEKLNREIREAEETDSTSREESFLENLRQKGLLSETPRQVPDDKFRQSFKRIEIEGEPLSETIIKERG
jgi:uncharacterized protein with WD repeat